MHETPGTAGGCGGVAHFLEHMAFKGSAAWPSRHALERAVEQRGARLDAFTSRESTAYIARALPEHAMRFALPVLSDIVTRPLLRHSDVEAERATVAREALEVDRQSEEIVHERLHAVAYASAAPALARPILGTDPSRVARADLVRFRSEHYEPRRAVVAAVGPVDHEELVRSASSLEFGSSSVAGHELSSRRLPLLEAPFSGGVHYEESPEPLDTNPLATRAADPVVHVGIAVEAPPTTHEDFFALEVVKSCIGSWDMAEPGRVRSSLSPLATRVAAGGLAKRYHAFYNAYYNTGMFGVYFEAPVSKVSPMCREIISEWLRLSSSAATPAEFEAAKSASAIDMLSTLENSSSLCEDIARQALSSRDSAALLTPAEKAGRLLALDHTALRRAARVVRSVPVCAVVGVEERDRGAMPTYAQLQSWIEGTHWAQ
eukprot:m51a1_g3155 putative mitochondrial processing peptidase subunit beta (432) ;mRNA; f:343365-345127